MKAIEQYFPVVLLIVLYKVVPTLETVMKSLCVTILRRAIEKHFPVVLEVELTSQF